MNSDNIFLANQKRVIIDGLKNQNDYTLSNQMIQRLLAEFGHSLSLVKIDGILDWLKERGIISIAELEGELRTARLSSWGLDVAMGRQDVKGIDRPLPEA